MTLRRLTVAAILLTSASAPVLNFGALHYRGAPIVNLNSYRLYQLFKYAVYAALALNVYLFFSKEWAAMGHRFAAGLSPGDIIEGFTSTIDTAAWVVLLLMFELETYTLDDHHFTPRVTFSLRALRALCFAFVVYAFSGYLTNLQFLFGATELGPSANLCTLARDNWSYAIDLNRYVSLTAENCTSFGAAEAFVRFPESTTVVDSARYIDILRLAWVDVINSATWIGVVVVLEADVRLQDRGLLSGPLLTLSNLLKLVFYPTLFLAAVYWGFKGDFVEFWDAFLWLVAFVFIERNVIEWRHEDEAKPPLVLAG